MANQNNGSISREQFEKAFRQMNGSWSYENSSLSEAEKEMLFKRLNGEISDEEYNRFFIEGKGKGK